MRPSASRSGSDDCPDACSALSASCKLVSVCVLVSAGGFDADSASCSIIVSYQKIGQNALENGVKEALKNRAERPIIQLYAVAGAQSSPGLIGTGDETVT